MFLGERLGGLGGVHFGRGGSPLGVDGPALGFGHGLLELQSPPGREVGLVREFGLQFPCAGQGLVVLGVNRRACLVGLQRRCLQPDHPRSGVAVSLLRLGAGPLGFRTGLLGL